MNYQIEKSPNLSEVELIYKSKVKMSLLRKVINSKEVAEVLKEVYNPETIEHTETFVILLMNRANKVLGWAKISQGGVAATTCDPKVIFQLAINANASAIIISHNHPSGNLTPSQSDRDITRKIKDGGKLLEIKLLDHVIMTAESYYSFADERML